MGSQLEILFHEILDVHKDPLWLNNIFLFSTEIWAEQLKTTLYVPFILYSNGGPKPYVEAFLKTCRCTPPLNQTRKDQHISLDVADIERTQQISVKSD